MSLPIRNLLALITVSLTPGLSASHQKAGQSVAMPGLGGYSIVRPAALPKTDAFVLKDMRGLLARGLGGKKLPVCDLGAAPVTKRIFFGMPPSGFDIASLADQEHVVEVRDGDVYLFGGGTNGTRYAAYDFLQGVLGYRFFDMRGGMSVPDLTAPTLTNGVRRHVPAFETRSLPCWRLYGGAEMAMFLFRHGMNGAVDGSFENLVARECGEGAAVSDDFNAPYPGSHSLMFYVPRNSAAHSLESIRKRAGGNLEALHPEWFSLQGGRRVFGHQRCLSNPDVRTFLKEGIYPRMASYKPRWLTYFDLSAGDTPGRFCECEGCSALEAKYGTTAGPLLDVALELCAGAAERYPRRNVKMLVYRKAQTQRPPKGIERLPDNFVPQFAPIDDDFSKDWTHQNNADTLADLKEWCSLSRRTLLWYYPNPYGGVTPPFGNVERFANDLRIAKEAGVTGLTVEHDVGVTEMTGFTELQTYILATMWNDASKDCRSLVREFVDFEYGAASGEMAAYLAELEALRRESTTVFSWEASRSLAYYGYLTPERLMRWESAFDRMEALLAGDRTRLRNLRRVRYNLDSALLAKHREVSRACGDAAPSVETLADRIEAIASEIAEDCYVEKYAGKAAEFKKSVANRVYLKRLMGGKGAAGLPEDIFGNVPQANICITLPISYDGGRRPDSAAAYGVAALFEGVKRPEVMKLPFVMSFSTALPTSKFVPRIGRGVDAENIGPRGKYRFYDMGELTVTRDCYVRLGDTYWFQANISEAYVEGSFNKARVYASLKFQGPAFYPEDVGGKNQVWCDRVVVVQE